MPSDEWKKNASGIWVPPDEPATVVPPVFAVKVRGFQPEEAHGGDEGAPSGGSK